MYVCSSYNTLQRVAGRLYYVITTKDDFKSLNLLVLIMSSFNKLKRNRPACPVILEWLESAWYHLLRPFRRTLRSHGILEKIDLFFEIFIRN